MKNDELCSTIIPFNINRKCFSDLTGAFLHKSSRGHLYVMVMYNYDGNKILDEPVKNRQAATICDSFLNVHKALKARGSEPEVYTMGTDCSSDLKETMKNYGIDFQMDPLHIHRKNAVELAIITYKNHFIYGFSRTDPYFPIS